MGGTFMFVYEEAWDYEGYLNSDLFGIQKKNRKKIFFDEINFISRYRRKKSEVSKNLVNIVYILQKYIVPDCRVVVSFFLEKILPDLMKNITVKYFFLGKENKSIYFLFHSEKFAYSHLFLVEDTKRGEGRNLLEYLKKVYLLFIEKI